MILLFPPWAKGEVAMIAIASPFFTMPFLRSAFSDSEIILSVLSGNFIICGDIPQYRLILLQMSSLPVKQVIGVCGLNFDTRSAVKPLLLNATIVFAFLSIAVEHAASAMACAKLSEIIFSGEFFIEVVSVK